MRLLADTHVHVYPHFPLEGVGAAALRNLAPGPDEEAALFLTERQGECWYRELAGGNIMLPDGWHAEAASDGQVQWLVASDHGRVLIVPGRQLISAERIEILCLTHDLDQADGAPASELLEAVRSAGGVPVLPWSPGKWLGARGEVVRQLITDAVPGSLLVGDTAMRPLLGPAPSPMRIARQRGLACVAGTDPLPVPGDESIIGQYGTSLPFDPEHPLAGIRTALASPPSGELRFVGRRSPLVRSLRRWIALKRRG